jgi:two-component system, response regulator YesN
MWNVVVIDDEVRITNGLAKIIEHINSQYHVIQRFCDSEVAYRWLQTEYSSVDLLITDISMPRMTGLELVENIRVFAPRLPCIILTGYGEFEYAKKAITLGVIAFLLKPVDTEELAGVISRLMLNPQIVQTESIVLRSALSREIRFLKNEIETNYQRFDINTIADQLLLNKEYLARLFKKEMGITIVTYLVDIRMQQARIFLSEPGKYKVYEVSELVGYKDQIYFSKLFKKKFGITPKDYQRYGSILKK